MAIDLRSDTVTQPTTAMRAVMASADVGDDVYGEDPTVTKLQDTVAELLGVEAALFVPSGTMANQIALKAHTNPGDEVIAGRDAHCWLFESGALAALAGAQTQLTASHRFTGAEVRAMYRAASNPYVSPTRVVAVENTHNWGGGLVWEAAALREVTDAAHELGMVTHLDGARLWNAAIASGASEKTLAQGFDSISVCLSKGLGAPVGSLVCGKRDFIVRCHRLRKMYGGGMRQAGILAAAGLHALEHHRARISDDHANARSLAERVANAANVSVDLATVQTNVVMIDLTSTIAPQVIARAKEHGVLLGVVNPTRIRAVTHLDVDRAACLRAAEVIADAAAAVA